MKDTQFTKRVVFTCSLVPAVMIAFDYANGAVSDAPTLMRNTGICTLIFLALSLSVTPLRRLTGKNYWSLFRRMLGLYAFFYACLHVLVYCFKIQGGDVNAILRDIFGNRYIFFGASAFILLVPLAATSTVWAIKKMGNKKWKLLHKLVYLTAICAAIHYLLTPKNVTPLKITFACILGGLLLFRVLAWTRDTWFPAPKPARASARKISPSVASRS